MKKRIASSIHGRGRLLLVAICVSVGVGAFAVQALGSFGPAKHFATGNSPIAVAVGNFNRDSHVDLAVASGDNVAVLPGKGAGDFGKAKHFAAGEFPISVAVGNLNGDTNPDLAVANYLSSNVSVLLGNGSGGFGVAKNFAVSSVSGLYSVAVGNLNGDTNRDLAVVNYGTGKASVLLGNGDGTFGAATNFAVGKLPRAVAIGNLNGDSHPDLAVANRASDNVSVLLGNGDGTFGAATNFAAGDGATSVAIGNLNGDSRPDIAAANYNSNDVSVLLGKGDGSFGKAKDFAVGTHPTSVAIGNLNGDSHRDLAVTNQNSDNVSVLLGNGNGFFGSASGYPLRPRPANPQSVAIGNFNAGSDPDLAVATEGSKGVSILLNAGPSPRTLTLSYRSKKQRFTGRLESDDPACIKSQRVRVLRRRSGPDPEVGSALSAPNGTYKIGHSAKPGTYYARVRAWSACRAERSKTVTIG